LSDDDDAPRIVDDDDGSISKQQREKKEPRGEGENRAVEGSRVVVFGEGNKEARKRRRQRIGGSSFGFGTIARDDPLLERGERND